jgi:hypothetical protein
VIRFLILQTTVTKWVCAVDGAMFEHFQTSTFFLAAHRFGLLATEEWTVRLLLRRNCSDTARQPPAKKY